MNILYCGDRNTEDGLLISILSLVHNVTEPLHIYVLTMDLTVGEKKYIPITQTFTTFMNDFVKSVNPDNKVVRIDMTDEFEKEKPIANLNTRFTPYCMLRLWADKVNQLPQRVLYLDNDVICRKDFSQFYHQDMSKYEIAGILDYYGKWFFRRKLTHLDYLNSGVLLMNLEMIGDTGLLEKCRKLCREKEMFMPDQSALNKLAIAKKAQPRHFNEQHRLRDDTVLQHFTTSFRFFPWLHTITVKPWQIEKMHTKLKLHEYDGLLEEYKQLLPEISAADNGGIFE